MPQWIKLETWAEQVYGADKPDARTMRRWAANGNIYPPAAKHGKCWYVKPDAQHCDTHTGTIADKMRAYYRGASKT